MSESSEQARVSAGDVFTQSLVPKLQSHPKRIVFTDGADERILRVAERMVKSEVGIPILLGNRQEIYQLAEAHGISLDFVKVLEPSAAGDFEVFCDFLRRTEHVRGVEISNPEEILRRLLPSRSSPSNLTISTTTLIICSLGYEHKKLFAEEHFP